MSIVQRIVRKLRRLFEPAVSAHVETKLDYEVLGIGDYGSWATFVGGVEQSSVIYSFGVGEDATWDTALIEKCGVTVHAFDPTPKSINWVKQQTWPTQFVFHDYGVAGHDGAQHFTEPVKAHWVSYSPARRGTGVEAPVKKLTTIMRELGHDHIDILKMDIEGGEYEVIDDLIKSHIPIKQLLVEFHHRFDEVGTHKTIRALRSLNRAGYRIFYISPGNDEYSLINTL